MKVLLFGATGMVGQGVLRECLSDPEVEMVQTVGRTITGIQHPKLGEVAHQNLWSYEPIEGMLSGFDACFFCLGVSSVGMNAEEYKRITYEGTLAAAETLCRLNPHMTFVYVSGEGTDSSERGRVAWARVKGQTENALLRLPFKAAYMFRPGVIQPMHGIRPRARAYRVLYSLAGPLIPLLRQMFPNAILTTEQMGRAMIHVVKQGTPAAILNSRAIGALAG
jgi:uncharacterized protein YbjT (DUF2867 family)